MALQPITTHPDKPPAEYKDMYTSYEEMEDNPAMLSPACMRAFIESVDADPTDPRVFIALSKNHAKYPPTYIATAGKDPLRDDGKIMADLLRKAGVRVKYDEYAGLPHYFWTLPGGSYVTRFMNNIIDETRWVLSG